MVVLTNTGLPQIIYDAIKSEISQKKYNSHYQFLQIAAIEKLEREGLINFNTITFIHYSCPECNRQIYVLPEIAGLYGFLYCSKCHPNSTTKDKSLIRNGTILGKDIPKNSEIRRC